MNRVVRFLGKWLCLALAMVGIFATGCRKQRFVWNTEEEYFELAYWHQRVRTFRKMKIPPDTAILFIGDSMTEGFDINRFFHAPDLVNMGISGDFTSGILRRKEILYDMQPKKVFLMIGINDILKLVPMERILLQYTQIIDGIRRNCPQTQLFIQSNLPTTCMGGTEETNAIVIQKVKHLNAFLQDQCKEKGAFFIDLYPIFESEDADLKQEYTYDGLHLSENGYRAWSDHIMHLVRE